MTNNQPQKGLNQLFNAYDAHTHVIRSRIEAYARLAWRALPDYYEKNIEAFVNELVPRVQAAQDSIAVLTDKYLSESAEVLGFGPSSGEIISDEISEGIRGVTPEEVYYRPAREVYRALGEGKTLEEATHAGELRLMSLIGSDIQMTRTHQLVRSYRRSGGSDGGGQQGPQYYRRVLTGRENCALCIVVSTQRYKVDKVMPVHPGCDCGFQPLPPGMTPAQVLDPDLLELVHKTVEERTGQSNRGATGYRELILTVEHSEHGHVLNWASPKRKATHSGTLDHMPQGLARYYRKRKVRMNNTDLGGARKDTIAAIKGIKARPEGFEFPKFVFTPEEVLKSGKGLIRGGFWIEKGTIHLNPWLKIHGLTPVHEIGHAIDAFLSPSAGRYCSEIEGTLPNRIYQSLLETKTVEFLQKTGIVYYYQPEEIFARAYAQFVAEVTRNDSYLREVTDMRDLNIRRQWTEEEFAEVMPLFKQLFGIS